MVAAQNVIPLETDPQPVPSKATLYAKLARVMGKVTRLAKGGENAHFNYKFVTDADVADMVRGALADENVAFLVNMVEAKTEIITLTSEYQGKTTTKQQAKTVVVFEFTFACGDTGATITKTWEGEAMDSQDKGRSKAATNAEKYFLMKTFLISSGDPAEDADSGPAPEQAKPAKPKQERRIDTSKDAPPPPAEDKPIPPPNVDADTGEITETAAVEDTAFTHFRKKNPDAHRADFNLAMNWLKLNDEFVGKTAQYLANRAAALIEVGAHKTQEETK